MGYTLPESLKEDISLFGNLAEDYKQKKITSDEFKAFRVPMGIYEQRQDEVYMSRVRTTGGVISPNQFRALIEIAQKHKSDLLHITTRQEIQIQNLQLENVEPALNDIRKIGLATKGGGGNTIRNMLVSEFSGISASEQFDTTPYAMAITSKLIAEADSYLMPRKMKFAFASDDTQIGQATVNDVGFIAKIKNGEKGFQIYVGGGAGAKPTIGWELFDFLPASKLNALTTALKKFFSDYGNRKNRNKARLRFVFYKLGEEETLRLIKEYYKEAEKTESDFVLPIENKAPQSKQTYKAPALSINEDDYQLWQKIYVTDQVQKGYKTILLPVLLGNIPLDDTKSLSDLQKLLKFIDQFGDDTIRFTTNQSIRLRNIPNEALPELFDIISNFVVDYTAPAIINNITSCTGADTCRLGIGLSKGLARAIREELIRSKLDLTKLSEARINISGCPNSCGMQLWGDIGFSGKVLRNDRAYPGYQVYLAAHRDVSPKFAESIGTLSSKDIPKFVSRLFENYLTVDTKHNSFTSYLETEGKELALSILEEYKIIPSFAENRKYYTDWGADKVFGVIGRGKAECAAGLFDMLEIDNSLIKASKEALQTETNLEKRSRLLYDIVFSSARMLLITRGAESKTTTEVYNLFIKHFIEFGFVEDKFRAIIEIARDNKNFDFNAEEPLIYELSDRIIELYQCLDDSLQFKNIPTKQ